MPRSFGIEIEDSQIVNTNFEEVHKQEILFTKFIYTLIHLGYQVVKYRDEAAMKTCWKFRK